MGQRNVTVDIMKGITILLVIIGHNGYVPSLIKQFIYAFHMPLFFILSGYFFNNTTSAAINFKRLLVPYIFSGLVVMFFHMFDALPYLNMDRLKLDLMKMFWGSGWYHTSPIFGDKPLVGAIWFLCALFWCKTIYGFLERRITNSLYLGIVCVAISISSIFLDRYCIYFPLSFFPGLSAIVFLYIGHYAKTIKSIPWWIPVVCIICYFFISLPFFGRSFIFISNCTYDIYPLTVLGAVGGTIITYSVSKVLFRCPMIKDALSWIGRLTLPILCFHYIQSNTLCYKPHSLSGKIFILIIALIFPLICSWICTKANVLGRIFGLRTNNR